MREIHRLSMFKLNMNQTCSPQSWNTGTLDPILFSYMRMGMYLVHMIFPYIYCAHKLTKVIKMLNFFTHVLLILFHPCIRFQTYFLMNVDGVGCYLQGDRLSEKI
jgi:hypothetical protein